jgi:DUF4097 and DUF4098 domain-containing protein YvlB
MGLTPRVMIAVWLFSLSGCMAAGPLTGQATDQWQRRYPLEDNGELQITNTNGAIELEGVDGSTVEVDAQRIARSATDALARELLPRITIKETVTSSHIELQTERLSGIVIGASAQVNYHIRVPRAALVRARTLNGAVKVEGLSGRLVVNTTNGALTARELSGGVEARAVNGRLEIALRSVGEDPIDLRTTNGAVRLTLPPEAKANVSATCVNGSIDASGLALDLMGEQSKRRLRGRMNGGGTPIELNTVNGKIELLSR